MAKHALLSASGAHRWLECTPSALLELQFPQSTSEYAEEGTAAHELCELTARYFLGEVSEMDFENRRDELAKGPYYNAEMQECANDYHRMNKDWTNEGGWLACDMRRYLNEEVIALLPDALIAAIKPRKFGEEEDKLWLFSEMEVFGEHDWTENDPDRGFQFEYFKDRRNRIKVDEDGDAGWWWERSHNGSDSNSFCYVSSDGNANINNANATTGVCFGFYI